MIVPGICLKRKEMDLKNIKEHISGSLFFDLDKKFRKNTNLPHMLTDKNNWEKIVLQMGIKPMRIKL